MSRLTQRQRIDEFGPPCDTSRQTVIRTPWGIPARVHKAIVVPFVSACADAADYPRWRPQRIDSYACRTVRGGAAHSLHAWALAFDFFATPPGVVPPGGVWTPTNGVPAHFAACFEAKGFTWGGRWGRPDVPHIEWAGPVPPPASSPTPAVVAASSHPPTPPPTTVATWEDDVPLTTIDVPVPTSPAGQPNAGCGWVLVPHSRDRIVGYTAPGLRPASDGRYESAEVGFAADEGGTVVSVIGWAPGHVAHVRITVAT